MSESLALNKHSQGRVVRVLFRDVGQFHVLDVRVLQKWKLVALAASVDDHK